MRAVRVSLYAAVALVTALALALNAGCTSGSLTVTVALAVASPTIAIGTTTTATATVTEGGVTQAGRSVTFTVADTNVATVSPATVVTNGSGVATTTITAVATGSTTISAATGGANTVSTTITVTDSGTGPVVTLTLSATSVQVGGTSTATATVTQGGAPVDGQAVTFLSADTGVASVAPSTASTNASGVATATVTALSAGTATITASVSSTSADSLTLTVTAAPSTTEYVIFGNRTQSEITQAENAAGGGTIMAANVGGGPVYPDTRDILGVQTGGTLALLVNQATGGAWIRDLSDGAETAFAPAGFTPQVGWATGAINAAGTRVYWLQQDGAGAQIRAADADGSNVSTVYSQATPDDPTTIALSPDGQVLAFITQNGEVRMVTVTGGTPTLFDLGTGYAPEALAWMDNVTLALAVRDGTNGTVTHEPAIMRAFAAGTPAEILYDNSGAGLASTPAGIAVDRDANILFDEEVGSGNHDIFRLDATTYSTPIAIVSRAEDDAQPLITAW